MPQSYIQNNIIMNLLGLDSTLYEISDIDEIFSDIDNYKKYSLVLLDFISKEPIDIVFSRHTQDMLPYFYSIDINERKRVKYLIADMYKPYKSLVKSVFPNAKYVIDSFHIISFLIREINNYINSVKRPIRKKICEFNEISPLSSFEKKEFAQLKYQYNLIHKYSWVILKNRSDVHLYSQARNNISIGKVVDTEMIIQLYYAANEKFKFIFEMKELYIEFNSTVFNSIDDASVRLDELIILYSKSKLHFFRKFASLLKTNKVGILNSFTFIHIGNTTRRLSNGPIESFNRKIKDSKRNARGYTNFDTFRKHILWSCRKDEPIKFQIIERTLA